jgi:predicted permease
MLRGSDRTLTASRKRHRARNTLVIIQVALALVMLVGAGLMIRTLVALHAVKPGFADPAHVQLARITIPEAQVKDPEAPFRMQEAIRDRIAALPGVAAVSFANRAPMESDESNDLILAEDRSDATGGVQPIRRYKFVAPGFFQTVGTSFVAGRDFTWNDLQIRRPVAIVSENLARELWGKPSAALGKRIRENRAEPWREIIGVVGDVHDDGVHDRAPTIAYWPVLMERFWGNRVFVQREVTFAIRSSRAGTEPFLEDLRKAVWTVNASLPLIEVRTLEDVYGRSLARASFTLVMLTIAATMALLLGIIGVYGVISYAVTQRTREIGVRLALGAQPWELKRMFVRYGLVLSGIGLVCGASAALALSRLMTSLLFGISALDPVTYVAVSLVLVSSGALASYVPARKVIAVDPVQALRSE